MNRCVGIGLILICVCVLACDSLFTTREPEDPKGTQSNWIPPLNPDQVLLNLQNAMFERNVENYIRCLVNPLYSNRVFRFDPDPEIAANYPDVFATWDRSQEETVIQQAFSIVPADSASFLQFTEDVQEIIAADSAVYIREYRLELHHGQSGLDVVYEGYVEFRLIPDDRGEWTIVHWIDNRTGETEPPWSLLKASLGG
jgi:hypothetical protein